MNTCLSDKAFIERTEIVSEHITERDSDAQRSMNYLPVRFCAWQGIRLPEAPEAEPEAFR
jgi:hypothetical protein